MKQLIVVEPIRKYIDFLNTHFWPHEIWTEGKQIMLSTPADGCPAPKKEILIGMRSYITEEAVDDIPK